MTTYTCITATQATMTSSPAKATQRLGAPSLITLMWTIIPLIKVFGFAILVTDLSWVRPHKFYASKLTSILLRCKRYILIRNGREERDRRTFILAKRAMFLQLYKFSPRYFKLSCRFFCSFFPTTHFYTEMDITQQT